MKGSVRLCAPTGIINHQSCGRELGFVDRFLFAHAGNVLLAIKKSVSFAAEL